jgi:hypothetical protein
LFKNGSLKNALYAPCGVPAQNPPAVHVSFVVHAFPSLQVLTTGTVVHAPLWHAKVAHTEGAPHDVPSGAALSSHAPLVGLHLPTLQTSEELTAKKQSFARSTQWPF